MAHQDIAAALRVLSEALTEEVRRAMQEELRGRRGERKTDPRVNVDGSDEALMLALASRAVQMYAETHPRPPHVTQKQAAEMLGLSEPTVRKLVQSGALRLNRAGRIPIQQVDDLAALPGTPHIGPKAV